MRAVALRAATFISSVALAGAWTAGAWAGNAVLNVTITPLPNSVSLTRTSNDPSQASTSYAAYRVDLENNSTNTLNAVYFNATAASDGTDQPTYAEYSSSSGATCTGLGATAYCAFGTLQGAAKPGSKSSVVVVFKAPTTGALLTFKPTASYSTTGSSTATPSGITYVPTSGFASTDLIDPSTTTSVNSHVSTYVPSTGTAVCTGASCIPVGQNPTTMTMTVPTTPTGDGIATVAYGAPTSAAAVCSGFVCTEAKVSAPGLYSNLTFVLRRGAAFIASGAKIEKSPIGYYFDNGTFVDITKNFCPGFGTANPQPPTVPTGVDPATIAPCIAFRTAYPNNYKPNPALSGMFEWVIYSLHNGRFDM